MARQKVSMLARLALVVGEQERGLQQRCSAPRDPWKLARGYDSVVGTGGISMYALRVSGDL